MLPWYNCMVLNNHCTHLVFVTAIMCLHQKAVGKTPLIAMVSLGCQCHHRVPAFNCAMLYEQNISGFLQFLSKQHSNNFSCHQQSLWLREHCCQRRHKKTVTVGDTGSGSAQHPGSWLGCKHPDVMLLCGSNRKATGPQPSPIVPEPQGCCGLIAGTNGLAALQASCHQPQQMGTHCEGPVLAYCVEGPCAVADKNTVEIGSCKLFFSWGIYK